MKLLRVFCCWLHACLLPQGASSIQAADEQNKPPGLLQAKCLRQDTLLWHCQHARPCLYCCCISSRGPHLGRAAPDCLAAAETPSRGAAGIMVMAVGWRLSRCMVTTKGSLREVSIPIKSRSCTVNPAGTAVRGSLPAACAMWGAHARCTSQPHRQPPTLLESSPPLDLACGGVTLLAAVPPQAVPHGVAATCRHTYQPLVRQECFIAEGVFSKQPHAPVRENMVMQDNITVPSLSN